MKYVKILLLLIFILLLCYPVSAWLSGYDYRVPIEINNTGDNLTYYQYNFTVDTASLVSDGKMNANGSDCQITNATDVLQDFWNETEFNNSYTKIWVNATTLNNNSNTTHYIYYGNTSAVFNGNISNTAYKLGDTFTGSSLNTSKWTNESKGTGSYISVSSGECELYVPDNQICSANIRSIDTFTNNIAIRVSRKCPSDNEYIGFSLGGGTVCDDQGGTSDWWMTALKSGYWWLAAPADTDCKIHEMPSSGAKITLTASFSLPDADINNYRTFEYIYDQQGNLKWYIDRDDVRPLGEGFNKYASNPFSLPGDSTGYGAVHPDVLYFPAGEDGYKYWMYYEKGVASADCEVYLVRSNDGITWVETGISNPILESISGQEHIPDPDVIKIGSIWYMFLMRGVGGTSQIYCLNSTDGISWSNATMIVDRGGAGTWDEDDVVSPSVIYEGGIFYLWYSGEDANVYKLGLATSTDGITFTKDANNPIYGTTNNETWHSQVTKYNGYYWLYYNNETDSGYPICLAKSTDRKNFTPSSYNPVMSKSGTGWETTRLYRMSWIQNATGNSLLLDNKMGMYYSAYGGTYYKIGLAESWDNIDMGYELLKEVTDTTFLSNDKKIMFTQGAYSATNRGTPSFLDWVFIRKYTSPEPVASLGVEESAPSEAPIITLLSQTPSIIYKNSTGHLNISYGITHNSSGLNNTSISFIYRNYDYDLSDSNHSIRPSVNDLASEWNFDGRILRGANRNETLGLNFENNDTITGGDIYTWSGLDENSTKLTIVPVNSTYTKIYINATVHCIMPQMWYLDRTDQQEATKTQLPIHKTQNVLIKFWNFEIFKGNTDFLGVGYTDTSLSSNPALWPSDANPVNFYYVNSSYDPAIGGDPITSGYAVYMGSINASGWVDHVYSRSNSNYVRGFIDNNYLHTVINTTNISYLYFTSNTESSRPYYINMTNVASSTNVSFADTNTLWAGNTPPYTPQAYTPNVWFAFMKLNMSLDHKLYAADNNDLWGSSSMNRTNITQALFPPTTPVIDHFHFLGETDYDMDGVYYGNFSIGCGVSSDPDGGDVTHNLTLHYANNLTFVTIINNTFTDKDITHNGVYFDANFSSSPYYSDDVNYTLRLIATDDESESVTVWLGVNFTLSITPIITLYTPSTPVTTIQHDTQDFTINISQIVNVTWYIDGSVVSTENNTNYSTYSNSTAPIGTYNVTAYVENINGTRQQVWEWIVEDKVFAALLQLQADIDKMKRTQTIIQALIFLVIGVVVGVVAQRRRFNDEDSEKPIESKNN